MALELPKDISNSLGLEIQTPVEPVKEWPNAITPSPETPLPNVSTQKTVGPAPGDTDAPRGD